MKITQIAFEGVRPETIVFVPDVMSVIVLSINKQDLLKMSKLDVQSIENIVEGLREHVNSLNRIRGINAKE